MSGKVETREFQIGDYDAAVALWKSVEGVEIAEGDTREEIAEFLRCNPKLSRVALENNKVIGVVLCGHDARRGYIYHLAVDPACHGRGVGKRLVNEGLEGLRQAGLKRALILVDSENATGKAFWLRQGWEELSFAIVMGIDV